MQDVLSYLADHWRQRPSLAQLAGRAGLSPAHFQKLFTRWAGVSPQTVVRCFQHAEARGPLFDGHTVEAVADIVGVSAPGRLYDLFVAHEGVTPGAVVRRGAGLVLRYGHADTPFGRGFVVLAPQGLAGLGFVDPGAEDAVEADFRRRFPAAAWQRDDGAADAAAACLFAPRPQRVGLALFGPPFHLQVWKALLAIPDGAVTSYGALAAAIGQPTASRAVGAAVGANPLSWLIPCHRVLAADGRLNGYHWGLPRKAAMLTYEQLRLG